MPVISVLLPCYNAAPYLPDCIASLQAQTFADFEVLAVDDGSADETRALLEDWAARDHRVRLLAPGRVGLVAALSHAADQAQGSLLARMDADDAADPLRLSLQHQLLLEQPGVSACGAGVRYFPREQVRDGALAYEQWLNSLHQPAELARDIFVECPIAHPTLLLRRSAFQAVGGYQYRDWPEDYDLVLRLWAAGYQLANVPETLLQWRERTDRASRTDPRYAPEAFLRCKVHYLLSTALAGRAVIVWGAGPVGKAFARELQRQGGRLRAFIDIDRRKIGQTVYSAPVWPASRCGDVRDDFLVAAVGSHSARTEIRAALQAAGHVELRDFCAVA